MYYFLQANRDITQLFEFVDRDFDKQDKLVQLLEQLQREAREDDSKLFRVLVFCKTKRSADYVEQVDSRFLFKDLRLKFREYLIAF